MKMWKVTTLWPRWDKKKNPVGKFKMSQNMNVFLKEWNFYYTINGNVIEYFVGFSIWLQSHLSHAFFYSYVEHGRFEEEISLRVTFK